LEIELWFRHPVTNEYLPSRVQGEIILRKEGDLSDKLWDEEGLKRWEEEENGGQEWTGRVS
jgi:putative ATPase